jgi:hypothetical protein
MFVGMLRRGMKAANFSASGGYHVCNVAVILNESIRNRRGPRRVLTEQPGRSVDTLVLVL